MIAVRFTPQDVISDPAQQRGTTWARLRHVHYQATPLEAKANYPYFGHPSGQVHARDRIRSQCVES